MRLPRIRIPFARGRMNARKRRSYARTLRSIIELSDILIEMKGAVDRRSRLYQRLRLALENEVERLLALQQPV